MNIQIHKLNSSASACCGIAIMIDVFRSSNTIIACLESGASNIIPVAEVETALALKTGHPEYVLVGERGGLKLPNFDYGNSPAEMAKINLTDQTLILTTSAGTQAISAMNQADLILIGSFANAQAIVDYLHQKKPLEINILSAGVNGITPATEDDLCAEYIKSSILNLDSSYDIIKAQILASPSAARLTELNQLDDLEYCLQLNQSRIVPCYNKHTNLITKLI